MKWVLNIDPAAEGVTVTVTAPAETDEVRAIAALLAPYEAIPGWQGERMTPLEPARVARFFTRDKGVAAETVDGAVYALRLRLYELEQRLDARVFVRISQSEIINLRRVTALDLAFSGTIRLTLEGGAVCWVSRRNVKNIKRALGI